MIPLTVLQEHVIAREWAHVERRRRASRMHQIGHGGELAMEGIGEASRIDTGGLDRAGVGLAAGAVIAALRYAPFLDALGARRP